MPLESRLIRSYFAVQSRFVTAAAERASGAEEGIMDKMLRRIRGAIGMGLTWGVGWGVAGTVLAAITRFRADAPFPLIFGVLGFAAGVIFSAILALTESRRPFDEMSLPRFALWGATGGLLLSAIFARLASLEVGDILAIAPTFAVASAICASASLAMARRARPRDLLGVGGNIAAAKIADHETRKLI
jgi:ABC-type xylose transport system permease subunit